MAGIRTLLLLLCLTPHYGASVEIVGTPDVTVYEGENATLSCTTSCITENSRVLWNTNDSGVWLVNVFNELNIQNLGSRHSKFSVSVFNETCIPNKTLNLTSKLSIVDVVLAETGTYICVIASATNFQSINVGIKLNVVPLWLPICSGIPAFAFVGDSVTVSCLSEPEFPSTIKLSMSIYDQNKRVVKTMNQSESTNFTFSYVHIITPDDNVSYFICETTFYTSGKEQKRRTCTTNTLNIIPAPSVQVIPLNNTPFHSDDQVCFICVVTTASLTHLDVEYSWSRGDHENQVIKLGSGSKQHCIDRISLKDDQQLIICNVSNKYQLLATSNISIVVVEPTTNILSCDWSFSSELLLWLLLPTNICIIMVIVILVTCPRKRKKNSEVENLQLSRLQHMDDESVPENIYDGYDAPDSSRLSDEHGEHWFPHEVHQFSDTLEPGQEPPAHEEVDLGYLYQATTDIDAGQASQRTEDQGQHFEVGQNLRQNQYEQDALPRQRSLDTELNPRQQNDRHDVNIEQISSDAEDQGHLYEVVQDPIQHYDHNANPDHYSLDLEAKRPLYYVLEND